LRLRPLSDRRPGDEFLVPGPPTLIDAHGRGRRFHLARLPAPGPTTGRSTVSPQPPDDAPSDRRP
jgi:hypothetical protein